MFLVNFHFFWWKIGEIFSASTNFSLKPNIEKIAKKLNLSNSAIHGFFNGKSNNPEILDELLKFIRKYAKNRAEVASIFGKVNAKNMLKQ